MTKDETFKLVLEALESWVKGFPDIVVSIDKQAIVALKERLERTKPEQEDGCPVCGSDVHDRDALDKAEREIERLTALIAQRTWVGLTDEEMPTLTSGLGPITLMPFRETKAFIRAIEAKLKKKNT
jgi:hypothetical protein